MFIYPDPYHAVANPTPIRLVVLGGVDALVCHMDLQYILSDLRNYHKFSANFLYLSLFDALLHMPLDLVGG